MKNKLSRRGFLNAGAALGSGLAAHVNLLAQPTFGSTAAAVPSGDRVRFGIIGVGMQGAGLLGAARSLPGVECVAAADLYDGRHTLAKEITGNASLPTTRRYRELFDRKDIDCIVAALPDHWHKRVVVDACNAGKDIYCEKPMSHSAEEGFEMVAAAEKNKRIVQIGSQRVSSVLCTKARQLYHGGAIGDVEQVEHRHCPRCRRLTYIFDCRPPHCGSEFRLRENRILWKSQPQTHPSCWLVDPPAPAVRSSLRPGARRQRRVGAAHHHRRPVRRRGRRRRR